MSTTDFSDINAIRAEWPESSLDRAADLAAWQQGIRLYDNDDYSSMMQCASLLSRALAHSLYGDGLLRGDDLPGTVHKVIYCSLCAPPDGQTFREDAQKAARLGLTILRENGWIPARLGGRGLLDPMIDNPGNSLLLAAAIAPPGQVMGDLDNFLLVPPTPLFTAAVPAVPVDDAQELNDLLRRAESGDEASIACVAGMHLHLEGRNEEALAALEQAARLGSLDAMTTAAHVARELGRDSEAQFWLESAAQAGSHVAMFNMGLAAISNGDVPGAVVWYERSAEAGSLEALAALVQVANDCGDKDGERRWAERGSEAGHPFCMTRHALFMILDSPNDVVTIRRAAAILQVAAASGNTDAMVLAADAFNKLGQTAESQKWAAAARASGNPRIIGILDRNGY